MDRVEILTKILEKVTAENYLEIGVSDGWLFSQIEAPFKVGVDPLKPHPLVQKKFINGRSSRHYQMTSSDFFRNYVKLLRSKKMDVVFVDGLHTYRQALEDVNRSLLHLASGGCILMHDCSPSDAATATPAKSFEDAEAKHVPGWKGLWTGDVWKAIVHLRATRKDLRVFVLDCDFGVGVITRGRPDSNLDLGIKEISKLSYGDLARSRKRLLNLKSPSYLGTFLRSLKRGGGARP